MKKFKILSLVLCFVSILFFSCSKTGTQGPQGEKGPQGEIGAQGPKGDKGDQGTANVTYSAWINTNPWVTSTTSTGSGKNTFYFDLNAPKLTQSILDAGTVLIYAKFISDPDGGGIIKLLPSIYYNLGGASIEYRFQYGLLLNKIRIICDVLPNGIPSTSNQVRYVLIPGGVNARQSSPAPDPADYHAICQYYGIKE